MKGLFGGNRKRGFSSMPFLFVLAIVGLSIVLLFSSYSNRKANVLSAKITQRNSFVRHNKLEAFLNQVRCKMLAVVDIGCGNATTTPDQDIVLRTSGIALGVYQPAADPFSHGTAVDKYTEQVGKKPAFAWFSVKWQNANTGAYQQFDPRLLDQFRTRGIMPGLNWDASKGSALNKNQLNFSWQAITSGKHDTYITQSAKAVASYHYPFIMRVFEEMDGNWYPWGYNVNGNTNPADFVSAWKHIVDIFRKEGATNVQFAWCLAANILTPSRISQYGDILKQLYPGDNYVDWVALDGYSNLGGENLGSLQNVFQPSYQFLKSFTHRPMMFFEVGVTENPNDPMAKANWITQGFLTTIPTVFSDVKVVNWFNGSSDTNPNKPFKKIVNWTVDTSQNSLNAWRQVVASPLYQGSLIK